MTLLIWFIFLLRSLTVTHTAMFFWIFYFFWHYYLLYSGFLTFLKFWSMLLLSFHWLSFKLKKRCSFSSHSWLRWSSWSFKRCSMGGYLQTWHFCCCWILWVVPGWNWCIYIPSKISGQAFLISMIFSHLYCCHGP